MARSCTLPRKLIAYRCLTLLSSLMTRQPVTDLLHPAHPQGGHDDHAQDDDEEAGDQTVADAEAVQPTEELLTRNDRPRATSAGGLLLYIGRRRRNGNVRWRTTKRPRAPT